MWGPALAAACMQGAAGAVLGLHCTPQSALSVTSEVPKAATAHIHEALTVRSTLAQATPASAHTLTLSSNIKIQKPMHYIARKSAQPTLMAFDILTLSRAASLGPGRGG